MLVDPKGTDLSAWDIYIPASQSVPDCFQSSHLVLRTAMYLNSVTQACFVLPSLQETTASVPVDAPGFTQLIARTGPNDAVLLFEAENSLYPGKESPLTLRLGRLMKYCPNATVTKY